MWSTSNLSDSSAWWKWHGLWESTFLGCDLHHASPSSGVTGTMLLPPQVWLAPCLYFLRGVCDWLLASSFGVIGTRSMPFERTLEVLQKRGVMSCCGHTYPGRRPGKSWVLQEMGALSCSGHTYHGRGPWICGLIKLPILLLEYDLIPVKYT